MSQTSVVCFYHKQCVDGTTSAAVVQKVYPDALFFPVAFDTVLEDMAPALLHINLDTLVIFTDITIGLENVVTQALSVLVLDHHISERERVLVLEKEHKNLTYVFDNAESGASLTWRHFFPDQVLPSLISYVRDIDLYTNQLLPESEWMSTYLAQYRDNPEIVCALLDQDLTELLQLGKTLTEYIELEIEKMCRLKPVYLKTAVGTVPAYNITNYQSKAGNYLATETGSAVVLYKISGESVRCSIRSLKGQSPSALAVATALGGGGHECSAGAGIKRTDFFSAIEQ